MIRLQCTERGLEGAAIPMHLGDMVLLINARSEHELLRVAQARKTAYSAEAACLRSPLFACSKSCELLGKIRPSDSAAIVPYADRSGICVNADVDTTPFAFCNLAALLRNV